MCNFEKPIIIFLRNNNNRNNQVTICPISSNIDNRVQKSLNFPIISTQIQSNGTLVNNVTMRNNNHIGSASNANKVQISVSNNILIKTVRFKHLMQLKRVFVYYYSGWGVNKTPQGHIHVLR